MSTITFVHTFIGAVQIYGLSCHWSSCGGHVDALPYQNTVVVIRKILKWAWSFLNVVVINFGPTTAFLLSKSLTSEEKDLSVNWCNALVNHSITGTKNHDQAVHIGTLKRITWSLQERKLQPNHLQMAFRS